VDGPGFALVQQPLQEEEQRHVACHLVLHGLHCSVRPLSYISYIFYLLSAICRLSAQLLIHTCTSRRVAYLWKEGRGGGERK